jgi:AcrR family transcriptional regulator
MARKYTLKKRAEEQAQTRQRIVDAAVDLHGTLGPAQTTISAIAKRAGVQRVTVYDHFPDERAIFEACTSHYLAKHPPPEPTPWRQIQNPVERLRTALTEIYAYHRRTETMMTLTYRDAELKPVMLEVEAVQAHARHWGQITQELIESWNALEEKGLLVAAVRHALDFQTWRSLIRHQGLEDADAVELMVNLVRCSRAGTTKKKS